MEKINVANQEGKLFTVDKNELPQTLEAGYRIATPEEVSHAEALEQAGSGLGPLVAGAEAAASTATLGGSRYLEQAFGRTAEAQKLTAEANPTASGIVGPAAGIVASSLLAPGLGAGEAAAGGVEAAAEGAGGLAPALGKYLPMNMASQAGRAVEEAVGPAVAKGVSIVANPETRPIANAILTGAGKMATGSAVEGALYGFGQSVDEAALGDPDALGEKLIANMGLGSAMAGGIGLTIGAAKGLLDTSSIGQYLKRFSRKAPDTILPSESKAAMQGNDLEAAIRASQMPEAEKQTLLDKIAEAANFKKKKANASRIEEIGREYGLDVNATQTSDNEAVQFAADWLTHSKSPTPAAMAYAAKAEDAYRGAAEIVKNAAGADAERMTELEAGKAIKDELSGQMKREIATNSEIWDAVQPYAEAIKVNNRGINQMVKALEKSPEMTKFRGTEGSKFVQKFLGMFERLENLEDLEKLRKLIYSELTSFDNVNTKEMAAKLYWKIDDAFERYVEQHAETMKTPAARAKILQVVADRRAAKEGFKAFVEKYKPVLEGLGSSFDKTSSQMIKFISEMNPQKLINKMFQKGDIEFTQDIRKNFPSLFKVAQEHQIGKMIESSTNKKGFFEPLTFLSKYDKLAPEVQELMFDKGARKTLDDMREWFGSYPEKFNPSRTGYTNANREAFQSLTMYGMAASRDALMKKLIDYASQTGDVEGAKKMFHLRMLEKSNQEISGKIAKGTSALVTSGIKLAEIEGIKAKPTTKEDREKVVDMVQKYNADPEAFVEHLTEQTEALHQVAPGTAASAQATIARANAFLITKIPTGGQSGPLSTPYAPSAAEISSFQRYYDALQNPVSILYQANQGTLTPEAVEAVKTVMPTLMQEIQSHVIEEMSKKGHDLFKLPMQKKLGLSLLMGGDMMNATKQENLALNQASLASPGAQQAMNAMQGQVKTSQAGMSKITLANRMMGGPKASETEKVIS
jgi:hypothetical protein